jgi:hypothetical protein
VAACTAAPQERPAAAPALPATPAATAPQAPAPVVPSAPAPPAPARFATVDALLDAVEAKAATLRDFRASVGLETFDDVTGDVERRLGQLVFVQEEGKPATRRFAVVFEKFIDGAGRMDERPVRYLYADGWLTEADFTQRTLIRRQLARAGEGYDPLRPGEGPVPLPIGQRRADVQARFHAALAADAPPPSLAKLGRPLVGVALRPKDGTSERDLRAATVWYDAETLVPAGVEATRANGRTVVTLRGAAFNAGLDDAQRALLTLAAGATAGWRIDERPLPAPAAAGSAP